MGGQYVLSFVLTPATEGDNMVNFQQVNLIMLSFEKSTQAICESSSLPVGSLYGDVLKSGLYVA